MTAKGKILVVDDDRLVLATVTHGLAEAGYDIVDADNGDDAILLAREHRPALALLDIRMEGMSGFEVAEYLREQLQIPFMFLSAFSDEETLERVRQLGAVAYLVKPLDIREIVPAVEAALVHRAAAPPRSGAARTVPVGVAPAAEEGEAVLQQAVALAVGIAMERHRLGRVQALQRLRQQAQRAGLPLDAWCARQVAAVELLDGPA